MIRKLLIFGLPAFLGACSSLNSEFQCNEPAGVGCKPAYVIDKMVDEGAFEKEEVVQWEKSKTYPTPVSGTHDLRISERVMRIWIAPFEDKNGKWHTGHRLYQVVSPGKWSLRKEKNNG